MQKQKVHDLITIPVYVPFVSR